MAPPEKREGRPRTGPATSEDLHAQTSLPRPSDLLADLDTLAEHLRGYFAVQVTVDDDGHRRTNLYRSAGAAERAVTRARDRGRTAHVTLVQLLPVGVVTGMNRGGAA